jgi:Na+-transporting NADH:ubiquinone oxidoreductase subunit NqrB
MRTAASLVLMMFMFFIATPTIVSLIEKSSDTSYFYSMSEEELSHKEIKAEFLFEDHALQFHFAEVGSGAILYENLSRHDNVFGTIFIPPPEQA